MKEIIIDGIKYNLVPIKEEQLKVMPWLFDMYQQVLKER